MQRMAAIILAMCLMTFTSFAVDPFDIIVVDPDEVIYLDSGDIQDVEEEDLEIIDSGDLTEPTDPGAAVSLDKLYYKLDVISAQLYVMIGIVFILILLRLVR